LAAATGVPSLNRNFVHPILVRVPNRREQIRQVALVQTINDKIMLEDMNVHKLRTLKKGLMDDLLTGRVRVKQSIGEPQ